jgi:hypothetical protein
MYRDTMKEIDKKQAIIEETSILPCLDRLVELKITSTLQQKHMRSDYNLLQATIEDLQLAYRTSLRLRAIQQLLTYVFDYEIQAKQNKLSVLETLTDDLEEKVKIQEGTQKVTKGDAMPTNQKYNEILKMLEVNDLKSAVKKLEKMQKKKTRNDTKWVDDLQHQFNDISEL